jgi:transcriptional regulator with XRE-family HTH domain
MQDTSSFNTVAHLRKILQRTQEDFAVLAGVSRNAVASLESGRLKLSARLANKISEQTNVNPHWLLTADPSAPMVNCDNQPWRQEDFEAAQKDLQERDLAVELLEREMATEVCTAYIFLQRALQAASKRNAFAVSQFRHRLEDFIRSEIHQFRELRDEVYAELRNWNERYVGTGRSYPKSLLFPRDTADFEKGRQEFKAAIEWRKEWEKQIGPPKLRTSLAGRYKAAKNG